MDKLMVGYGVTNTGQSNNSPVQLAIMMPTTIDPSNIVKKTTNRELTLLEKQQLAKSIETCSNSQIITMQNNKQQLKTNTDLLTENLMTSNLADLTMSNSKSLFNKQPKHSSNIIKSSNFNSNDFFDQFANDNNTSTLMNRNLGINTSNVNNGNMGFFGNLALAGPSTTYVQNNQNMNNNNSHMLSSTMKLPAANNTKKTAIDDLEDLFG